MRKCRSRISRHRGSNRGGSLQLTSRLRSSWEASYEGSIREQVDPRLHAALNDTPEAVGAVKARKYQPSGFGR
ncbi:hypothetical protein ACHWQZ_G018529 [Mnemiopsis leidyi]